MASASNLYPGFNQSEIAEDRRAISEKIARHKQSQRGNFSSNSQRSGFGNENSNRSLESEGGPLIKQKSSNKGFEQKTTTGTQQNKYLDRIGFAQDDQAINEKLRRHRRTLRQSSKRNAGGFEDSVEEDDEEELASIQLETDSQQNEMEYDSDVSESTDLMKATLGKDGSRIGSFSRDKLMKQRASSRRVRRHDGHTSPVDNTPSFISRDIETEIPSTQSVEKTLSAFLYVLLCIAILVSFVFLLEGLKLTAEKYI
jgi:hypothetical protein